MKQLGTGGLTVGMLGMLLNALTSSVWPCICLGTLVLVVMAFLAWVIADEKRPGRLAMALRGTPEPHCSTESHVSSPSHPPEDAPLSS